MYYYYSREGCQEQSSEMSRSRSEPSPSMHRGWAWARAVPTSPQSSGGNVFNCVTLALSGPRGYWSYNNCWISRLQSPAAGINRGKPRGIWVYKKIRLEMELLSPGPDILSGPGPSLTGQAFSRPSVPGLTMALRRCPRLPVFWVLCPCCSPREPWALHQEPTAV